MIVLHEGDDGYMYLMNPDGTRERTALRYGRSPGVEALADLRAWDMAPLEEKVRAASAHVSRKLDCPVCAARREAKRLSQAKWRAKR